MEKLRVRSIDISVAGQVGGVVFNPAQGEGQAAGER